MLTKQKNKSETLGTTSSLLKEAQAILEAPTQEEYRYVVIRGTSCCGCGCSEVKLKRKVPYDSPLQDGDYVGSDIHDDDEWL